MLTQLFIKLGWSREDRKWWIAQLLSVCTLIANNVIDLPYWFAFIGVPVSQLWVNRIMVLAVIVLWIAGKYDTSGLYDARTMASGKVPGSPAAEKGKIDVSKIAPLILLCVLGLGVSAGCALKGDARHRAVVASTGLYTAIALIDDTEMTLHQTGAITTDQHRALNPKIVALLTAGRAANGAIATWPQGAPAPAELQTAIQQLTAVSDAVIDVLPDSPGKAKLQATLLRAVAVANALLLARLITTGGM